MKKSTEKWVYFILSILFVVLGIIALKKIEWLEIFGMELYVVLFIIAFCCLLGVYICFIPSREAKVYLGPNRLPDINTERVYDAKKLLFGQGFITRRSKFALPWSTLKTFWVKSGWIGIIAKNGRSFDAPLSDVTVRYQIENDKISGYSLKDTRYNDKITIYYPGAAFEEEEWKDIMGVLSQASDVKESRMSKISRWLMKIKDLDFVDIIGSGIRNYSADLLVNYAVSDNNYLNTRKGKIKRIIKRTILCLLIIFIIYSVVEDILLQVEKHKIEAGIQDTNLDTDQAYSVASTINNESTASKVDPLQKFLSMTEDMSRFEVTGDHGVNGLLAIQPETGRGAFIDTKRNVYRLRIEEQNDDQTGFLCNLYKEDSNYPSYRIAVIFDGYGKEVYGEFLDLSTNEKFAYNGYGISSTRGAVSDGGVTKSTQSSYRVPSLLDMINPDNLTDELRIFRIGNNLVETIGEDVTSIGRIEARGVISDHEITMEGWLSKDGSIHGRYHNTNGVNLDFNGLLYPDGRLYIQLGHDSEKSDWYLHSVGHEMEDAYRYEGTWGKRELPSYVIFRVMEM